MVEINSSIRIWIFRSFNKMFQLCPVRKNCEAKLTLLGFCFGRLYTEWIFRSGLEDWNLYRINFGDESFSVNGFRVTWSIFIKAVLLRSIRSIAFRKPALTVGKQYLAKKFCLEIFQQSLFPERLGLNTQGGADCSSKTLSSSYSRVGLYSLSFLIPNSYL